MQNSSDKSISYGSTGFLVSSIYFGVTGILWFLLTFHTDRYGYGIKTSTEVLGWATGILLMLAWVVAFVLFVLSFVLFLKKKPDNYVLFCILGFVAICSSYIPGNAVAVLARGGGLVYPVVSEIFFSLLFILVGVYALLIYLKKIRFLEKPLPIAEPWRTMIFFVMMWLIIAALIAGEWESPLFILYYVMGLPAVALCGTIWNIPHNTYYTCISYLIPLVGVFMSILVGWFVNKRRTWKKNN